jgi:hypothetical protein
MPRQPTGNPRGRPVGSGTLGPQTRFTVRIPTSLFDRLEAYAEGRSYTRGTPQLARCVREAIEHYLVCLNKRQTRNIPQTPECNNGQTLNEPQPHEYNNRQTINVLEAPAEPLAPTREPLEAPGYDTSKFSLGKLCRGGHEFQNTGQSLLTIDRRRCLACEAAAKREKRKAKHQAQLS